MGRLAEEKVTVLTFNITRRRRLHLSFLLRLGIIFHRVQIRVTLILHECAAEKSQFLPLVHGQLGLGVRSLLLHFVVIFVGVELVESNLVAGVHPQVRGDAPIQIEILLLRL